jgi:hypothetical protein
MRCIILSLMAVVLLGATVPTKPKSPAPKPQQQHRHMRHRNPGAWDPGYTLDNPFGMPREYRRPRR